MIRDSDSYMISGEKSNPTSLINFILDNTGRYSVDKVSYNFIDLEGQVFGRLKVLKRAENSNSGRAMWLCHCECGNEVIVSGVYLRNGRTVSCGCYRREKTIAYNTTTKTIHGEEGTRLYGIWSGIKTRTTNPNVHEYKNYGKRNIKMCDEWLNSYKAFSVWAKQSGYNDYLSIDRIDNNLGYSPENCRWATRKEQNNNKRTNFIVAYQGRTQSLAQWCEELSLNYDTIRQRIRDRGWSIEKAFETPIRPRKNKSY